MRHRLPIPVQQKEEEGDVHQSTKVSSEGVKLQGVETE